MNYNSKKQKQECQISICNIFFPMAHWVNLVSYPGYSNDRFQSFVSCFLHDQHRKPHPTQQCMEWNQIALMTPHVSQDLRVYTRHKQDCLKFYK